MDSHSCNALSFSGLLRDTGEMKRASVFER
jgi:hypothetical protein